MDCSIIYINELPLLFNLLKNAEFNRNYNIWKIMDHITVQFVNDGSNVWTLKDHINIKPHTESHFNSLYDYCTSTNLNLTPKDWIYYNRIYKEYTT